MGEFKIEDSARGTRILVGDLANKRRKIINSFIEIATQRGLH